VTIRQQRGVEVRALASAVVDMDEIYDVSYQRLVIQLYAFCGNVADAEDAVQEAFVTAIRTVSYTHHRAHETGAELVCSLLL
jgi:DNA-directed RNA polymerase specialized sigma24 family protein